MMDSKFFLMLFLFLSLFSLGFSQEYSQKTFDFRTNSELNTIISTNTDFVDFSFQLENTQSTSQKFNLNLTGDLKWKTDFAFSNIELKPYEKREFTFRVSAPDELGYKKIIDSQGLSKFELDDEYFGEFDFLVGIDAVNSEDDFKIVYSLDVYSPTNLPVEFELSPSSLYVSPDSPISIRFSAFNLDEDLGVQTQIFAQLSSQSEVIKLDSLDVAFNSLQNVKDISFNVPASVQPGEYELLVEVKVDSGNGKKKSWELTEVVEVLEFENLKANYEKKYSFWAFRDVIEVQNLGNVDSIFEHKIQLMWYERIFLSTQMNTLIENGEHTFSSTVEAGETETFEISFRYGIILLILIVIVIIWGIRTYQEYKNPIEVDLKFEKIKKVKHEGIKSFKIKLGFENIRRQEIDTLRVTFRMPSYLHVKDESFSLTPPTKVLKGSSKYKLIWEFKRFEKGDARILGFDLTNSKGILGDIHFEDLEFEVISNGKTSKYHTKIKTIQG